MASSINSESEGEGKRKKVVVVGGGIAGSLIAKYLQSHAHVSLIDPKEYLRITWASLRAMVEPSFGEKSLINYRDIFTDVQLITSAAAKITESAVLTLQGDRVPYDYLVVATGHEDPSPVTKSEILLQYEKAHETIKSADSILVIGGGPTGVELAGEIAIDFPEKKVILVHRGSRLLEFIGWKASKKALDWLVSKKVGVILDHSVNLGLLSEGIIETSSGETIKFDSYFDCTGKPIGSFWLKDTILKDSLDIQGRLEVDDNLRVKRYKNVFAIGDITSIPEIKQGFYAMKQAEVAAKNIRLLLGGGNESKLVGYRPGKSVAFVSLGRKEAVAQVLCFALCGRLPGMIKSGDLFLGKTRRRYGV